MPIVQSGTANLTAQVDPGVIVNLLSAGIAQLNGVPTNGVGIVGTASWGPVNSYQTVSDYASFVTIFGNAKARPFDAGTHVISAIYQKASNFAVVRVTDSTDVNATATIQVASTTAATVTAKYSGTVGNTVQVQFSTGSKAASIRAVITIPGVVSEVYDNLPAVGSTFWPAFVAAVNNGLATQGPSNIVKATIGTSTTLPTLPMTTTLTGGTDGASGVTASSLVGTDSAPRTGMYALRNSGVSIVDLADSDSTTWAAQEAFGLGEGALMVCAGASGETITSAITAKQTAAIDTPAVKVLLGDYLLFADPVNSVSRYVSPAGAVAGLLANLSPEQSPLNKPIVGFSGSQKNGAYSTAELQQIILAGLDVVASPSSGGTYFSCQSGTNSSSDSTRNQDNWTRLTNYLAATLESGMGKYIGATINTDTMNAVKSTLVNFLTAMVNTKMLARDSSGKLPFSVVCDSTNNLQSQTALGYLTVDVRITYQGIVRFLIINLVAGAGVTITVQ